MIGGRSKEVIPGFRAATFYEAQKIEQVLKPIYEANCGHGGRLSGILGGGFGLLALLSILLKANSVYENIGLLILAIGLFALSCYMRKHEKRSRAKLNELIQGNYQVVKAWADAIHPVMGDSPTGSYGVAKITLNDGTQLKRKYILSYAQALELQHSHKVHRQPVLIVHLSLYDETWIVAMEV